MNHTLITVVGIAFIFLMTTLGSAVVFFFKRNVPPSFNIVFMGFAAGVMIAASIWSLILPSLEQSNTYGKWKWIPAAVGILIGGLFLTLLSAICKRAREGLQNCDIKNLTSKLFVAITVHNIPEGLAVGFAFGAAAVIGTDVAYLVALGLSIGIGVQNFPEGAAVSLPMRAISGKRWKSFLIGVSSGVVEPIFAIIGYFLASTLSVIQPWLLAFSAGAMIFVVAEDLIPNAKSERYEHLGAWSVLIGFVVMMVLDVALS